MTTELTPVPVVTADQLEIVKNMRSEPNLRLEQIRVDGPPNCNVGSFRLGSLAIIVSNGLGWDHVSVSRKDRCPTWDEMDRVKQLCFRDDEVVMQLHINDSRKVDTHKFCLHLWRPQTLDEIAAIRMAWGVEWVYGDLMSPGAIPLPQQEMV